MNLDLMIRNVGATVWITYIMTLFTVIVSTVSKPLGGRLNHHVTVMGNQVMMTVIHTATLAVALLTIPHPSLEP